MESNVVVFLGCIKILGRTRYNRARAFFTPTRAVIADEQGHELYFIFTRAAAGDFPQEITIEDKTANEQLKLISQLDEEDKQTIFKLIDQMLTNKKFKSFFKENIGE